MKRGQRSPGSKACPKLKTLPLPVNSIEFRLAAPMASAAAASPVRCCAWLGADSTTANPATRVQYIRIIGSSQDVKSDCRRIWSCHHRPARRAPSDARIEARLTAAASEEHAEPIALAWDFPASGLEASQPRSHPASRLRAAPAEDRSRADLLASDCFASSAASRATSGEAAACERELRRHLAKIPSSLRGRLVRPQNLAT